MEPLSILKMAEYGIGALAIGSLLWVVGQVFKVIQNNTSALQELITLIREQSGLLKDLSQEVSCLKENDAYRRGKEDGMKSNG